jgi:hypothetical protein
VSTTETTSDCPLDYTLQLWDESLQLWEDWNSSDYAVISWVTSTGVMTLETSDYNTYDDYSVVARISASDPYSDVTDKNEVYDQFTIDVRDECHDI